MNLYDLIQQATATWIAQERAVAQSIPGRIVDHIVATGRLRLPQREAIEVYLWLKFVGKNQSLGDLIRSGALTELLPPRCVIDQDHARSFLLAFAKANDLKTLAEEVREDWQGQEAKWNRFLDALLHDFSYPLYLYSLPMGAGKTYLMAALIYLDLHFARLHPGDSRFASNFIVFAPQASKTAILPSLQTIRNFDPAWVLPPADAATLRRLIHFEILDSLSSSRRDKLHGNNPNLEKVNRLTQTRDFGLVFITNAEKVVMEKLEDSDATYTHPDSPYFDAEKSAALRKVNDLREKLSLIPGLSVILDEAHHFFSASGDDEKKLKLAVDILNQHGHVRTVHGFSGTPYVKHHVPLGTAKLKLNQIQLITYHYSLAEGIGRFLKIPEVIGQNAAATGFVDEALSRFFADFDRIYPDGTASKIAFYCPSIEKLNSEILPAIRAWYASHRPGQEDAEIFRFYRGVKKSQKQYALPKENDAIFANLDQPHIRKRVILLVAIGTEGWDCKSLTAVALPRKQTTKNFVLQTTCRCLREVVNAADETALIALGEGNYETLDKELKENYALSIADLRVHHDNAITVHVRKPQLGTLRFKNVRRHYSIVRESRDADVAAQLASFDFGLFRTTHPFTPTLATATVGKKGLANETTRILQTAGSAHRLAFADFLNALAQATWAGFTQADLVMRHDSVLRTIHAELSSQLGWIALHPTLALSEIIAHVAALLMLNVTVTHENLEEDVEIELLDWHMDPPPSIATVGGRFLPAFTHSEVPRLNKRPYYLDDRIEDDSLDPHDLTFNYAPYRFDSQYEVNALLALRKMAELRGLEFYYNGYRNGALQSLVIRTPYGNYTPDFLILKRLPATKPRRKTNPADAGLIDRVLILETKGRQFNDADFKAKEKFVKDVFLKRNPHFRYRCFVDDDDNDFNHHLADVAKEIQLL